MKRLIGVIGLALLLAPPAFARTRTAPTPREQSLLARITVYWASGGRGSDRYTRPHKCSPGVRLRGGHFAGDPRPVPYCSQNVFPHGVLSPVANPRAAVT